MPKYVSYRVPAEGELWYSSTGDQFYIADDTLGLRPLQFSLSRNHPKNLLQDIHGIRLIDGRVTIQGACNGQVGWSLVADDWLEYVKQLIRKTIEDMSKTLEQCAACVDGVECDM